MCQKKVLVSLDVLRDFFFAGLNFRDWPKIAKIAKIHSSRKKTCLQYSMLQKHRAGDHQIMPYYLAPYHVWDKGNVLIMGVFLFFCLSV